MSKLQENIQKAEAYFARFAEKGALNHINGEAVPALDGSTFETISPVDLKPLATVARGKSADIDRAARAAKAAFAEWAATRQCGGFAGRGSLRIEGWGYRQFPDGDPCPSWPRQQSPLCYAVCGIVGNSAQLLASGTCRIVPVSGA